MRTVHEYIEHSRGSKPTLTELRLYSILASDHADMVHDLYLSAELYKENAGQMIGKHLVEEVAREETEEMYRKPPLRAVESALIGFFPVNLIGVIASYAANTPSLPLSLRSQIHLETIKFWHMKTKPSPYSFWSMRYPLTCLGHDKDHILETLENCRCCVRHTGCATNDVRPSKSLKPWHKQWVEVQLDLEGNTTFKRCSCPCRHLWRMHS